MYGAKASNAQKGMTLHAIGEAYGNLGDYPNQLEHLQKSLAMFEKLYAPELNHSYIVNIRQLIEQVQKKFGG